MLKPLITAIRAIGALNGVFIGAACKIGDVREKNVIRLCAKNFNEHPYNVFCACRHQRDILARVPRDRGSLIILIMPLAEFFIFFFIAVISKIIEQTFIINERKRAYYNTSKEEIKMSSFCIPTFLFYQTPQYIYP